MFSPKQLKWWWNRILKRRENLEWEIIKRGSPSFIEGSCQRWSLYMKLELKLLQRELV